SIDPQIGALSILFDDDLQFGRTAGRILQSSGHSVLITDSPNLLEGVEISVLSGGGTAAAVLSLCDDQKQLQVLPGQSLTFTCPQTHSRLFAEHSIVIGHEADLAGNFFAGQFSLGNNVHLAGDLISTAGGSVGSDSVIDGDARLHGVLSGFRSAVLGRISEGGSIAAESITAHSGASSETASLHIANTPAAVDAVLSPGDYGVVTVDTGAKVEFDDSGLYRMVALEAEDDVTFVGRADGLTTVLAIDGDLQIGDGFSAQAADASDDIDTTFALYVAGTAIELGHQFTLQGSFEAPEAAVVVGHDAFFRDGIAASILNIGHNAALGVARPSRCASSQLVPVAASASSSENSAKTASKAIDGDLATRWSSAFSDPQWLSVDLGAVRVVNRVVLRWEAAYSRKYTIQMASSSAGPWITVYANNGGDGGTDDLRGILAAGRYLRVNSTERGTQWGNSLWELEVYGDTSDAADCAGPLQLLPSVATSSSNETSLLTASKAIDGSVSSRWSSAFSDPQWIVVDLGATRWIHRVRLDWEAAYSKKYDLMVSDSSSGPWTTVYSNESGDGGVDDVTGLDVSARYVRMYGRARNTTYGHSLWELKVYGTP
ncbi:MAG TPA: discoidin domain-containing protein, partial [Polyangiaceae bacterium]|nr:discoidin domain-containing protein [Polyangiaceae bacterium]